MIINEIEKTAVNTMISMTLSKVKISKKQKFSLKKKTNNMKKQIIKILKKKRSRRRYLRVSRQKGK